MRVLLAAALVLLATSAPIPALAQQIGCGIPPIPPIPPIGCRAMRPVCVCDNNGHCYWQFVCER